MVEDVDGDLLLGGQELAHRVVEVRLDDLLRPTEVGERLRPQLERAEFPLALPQPLHHELQVRRLDVPVGG